MKKVSIRTQKILMFIPYANIFNQFIWVYNCLVSEYPVHTGLKSLYIWLVYGLPIAIIHSVLDALFPEISHIATFLTMYLYGVLVSFGIIRFQQKQ